MVRVRARIIPFGFILCLLAVLVTGVTFGPHQALAKPVPIGGPDGTPYGNGDPTGDDQPSPTPKPTHYKAARIGSGTVTTVRVTFGPSVRWNLYLSILIRLGLR